MKIIVWFVALLFITTNVVASGKNPKWTEAEKKILADSVRQEFLYAWNSYKQYAWGHDQLKPLSKSYKDWYGTSLCMTPVDALDAMLIMGLKAEADSTREYIAKNLSFYKDIYVKTFELTTRILGGLLSGYELTGDRRLLDLAQEGGSRLLPSFSSPTGMPHVWVNLKTGAVLGDSSNPAEFGTLLVEFGTLTKYTDENIFYGKAKQALTEIYKRRSPIGLVGEKINVMTGQWIDTTSHIGGMIDSYYEYLLKCSILFDDKDCAEMWRNSIAAVNKYLSHSAANGFWYSHVDMNTLSGDLDRAKQLEESCYKMWTKFGIEPEELDYSTMKITKPGYPLRPEIIESAYYLYHYTHDDRYLEMGRTFFRSLVKYCRTDAGYAALKNVETKEKKDEMDSFFLAETLKYLYLLFAPAETLDFDKIIFSTEAHPIKKNN